MAKVGYSSHFHDKRANSGARRMPDCASHANLTAAPLARKFFNSCECMHIWHTLLSCDSNGMKPNDAATYGSTAWTSVTPSRRLKTPTIVLLKIRMRKTEVRYITLGMSVSLTLLIVVWTERTRDIIRIISARPASKGEAHQYSK